MAEYNPVDISQIKVLYVEDNLVSLNKNRMLLQKLDCNVETCETGEEALKLIELNKYDIIFLDIQIPEPDGYDIARLIRELKDEDKRKTPIVAVTANARFDDREKCLNAGMDDYIVKPARYEHFEEMLSKYVTHIKVVP